MNRLKKILITFGAIVVLIAILSIFTNWISVITGFIVN